MPLNVRDNLRVSQTKLSRGPSDSIHIQFDYSEANAKCMYCQSRTINLVRKVEAWIIERGNGIGNGKF